MSRSRSVHGGELGCRGRRWALALVATCAVVGLATPAGAQGADPLGPAAARVRVHDHRGALRLLDSLPPDSRQGVRARYLRGRLLERLGRQAEAARAWEGITGRLPEGVVRDVRFRRAGALARAGDCPAAVPLLRGVAGGSGRRAAIAQALLGQCAMADGDLERAIPELRTAARADAVGVDTFAVRLALAEALHRQGDAEAAVAELRSLLIDRAEHEDADRAFAQLEAWGVSTTFEVPQRIARAARLLDRRMPREALAELEGIDPPADPAERSRLLHLRGMALYGTRHDYAEAARVLARAARIRSSPTAEEDEFHAARALSRSDQDDLAIRAYRRFVRRHPRHRMAPLAEYLAAWLELHHGRLSGERNMRRFLGGPRGRARASLRRNAIWHLGLSAFERGRHGAAAERFEEYAGLGGPHAAMIRGRGLYWLGRARMGAGDGDRALSAWRATLSVEPLHWYAMLARERLAEAGEDPGPPFGPVEGGPQRAGAPPLDVPELPPDVAFYARLGLRGDAVDALRAQEDAVADAAPEGRELLALVTAYRAVGDASRPYRLAAIRGADELRRRPDAANRWVWEAAYPRPWRGEVERAARIHHLSPEYLWAIMRQESGYDPEAVSYADAVGLLQMLPRTAERVAEQLGVELRREMLFDPTWNLRLAAAYNGGLYETFDRRAPLSIGAYNAGGHRMREWLDGAPEEVELDLFVERIPFDQTRNYVRRVTTHLAKYLYLEDPQAGWPLTLLDL